MLLEPENHFVGTVNEDFAVESIPGDIFQLGNTAYRILRVERGVVRVEDAPACRRPFRSGSAKHRAAATSSPNPCHGCARMSVRVSRRGSPPGAALRWQMAEPRAKSARGAQLVDYLAAGHAALGVLADAGRYSSSSASSMRQAVCSSSFIRPSAVASIAPGAWRFANASAASSISSCRQPRPRTTSSSRSPPRTASRLRRSSALSPFGCSPPAPHPGSAQFADVHDALALGHRRLARPATLSRRQKVPAQLARMGAEDLIGSVFPDQVACGEIWGVSAESPIIRWSTRLSPTASREAMDIDGLERLLSARIGGAVRVVTRDLTEPSPLAHEVLSARPYAYLDDAPLEERRTQAVMARRWLSPEDAADLGRLDADAVARVRLRLGLRRPTR